MLKPIPLRALIDSVVHSPLTQGSRSNTYGPEATLTKVLVQNKNIRTSVDGSYIVTAGALMFWDVTYSDDATFNVGDRITYTDKASGDSVERYIMDILPAQTNEGLHHLELTLV